MRRQIASISIGPGQICKKKKKKSETATSGAPGEKSVEISFICFWWGALSDASNPGNVGMLQSLSFFFNVSLYTLAATAAWAVVCFSSTWLTKRFGFWAAAGEAVYSNS